MPTSLIRQPNDEETSASKALTPLNAIRTETVFSRLPIHNLAKKGRIDIQILRKNDQGEVDLRWEVSYNERHGQPRQLAYKLDTIVINRKIDELAKPLPPMICLGSLHTIAAELGLTRNTDAIKKAILQNVGSLITAKLRYTGLDGVERTVETTFTRYNVVFTGQRLPDGNKADAVYLILNEPYREVLNNAPTRPLDYEYLRVLGPAAQRFYEIMSYKIFAAIKYRHATAKISYSEYCTYSAQQHYQDYERVKKQMYKVHRPHLKSGYLKKVACQTMVNSEGKRDWMFHYTPGPKARAEFQVFNGRHFKIGSDDHPEPALTPESSEASATDNARDLVQYFHRRFHRADDVTLTAKDLEFAAALIAQYGMEKSRFVVDYSLEEAESTKYKPNMLVGIQQYVAAAIKKFDVREKHRQEEKRKEREGKLEDRYRAYKNAKIKEMEATLSAQELEDLKVGIRQKLLARNPNSDGIGLGVQMHLDSELAERAGVPPYEEWRKQYR